MPEAAGGSFKCAIRRAADVGLVAFCVVSVGGRAEVVPRGIAAVWVQQADMQRAIFWRDIAVAIWREMRIAAAFSFFVVDLLHAVQVRLMTSAFEGFPLFKPEFLRWTRAGAVQVRDHPSIFLLYRITCAG